MAVGVDGQVGNAAIGLTERAIVAKETAVLNHAGHLRAVALVWVVQKKALPRRQLELHGADAGR